MILIAVIDDSNGMTFHGRRQSQDQILRERILALAKGAKLYVTPYTKKQFRSDLEGQSLWVDKNCLEKAEKGDYCFVEDCAFAPYETKIEKIYLFKWNRRYPADFYFDIALSNDTWHLVSSEEFPGYSHDKITLEVYER